MWHPLQAAGPKKRATKYRRHVEREIQEYGKLNNYLSIPRLG